MSRQDRIVRVAGTMGATVGGMVGGALVTMLVASLMGIGPEIIILMMLIAEVACGGMAGCAADRRLKRWQDERAQRALSGLPEARLLASGRQRPRRGGRPRHGERPRHGGQPDRSPGPGDPDAGREE